MAPPKKLRGELVATTVRVPASIWQRARQKGIVMGVAMNWLIVKLLDAWAKGEVEVDLDSDLPADEGDSG